MYVFLLCPLLGFAIFLFFENQLFFLSPPFQLPPAHSICQYKFKYFASLTELRFFLSSLHTSIVNIFFSVERGFLFSLILLFLSILIFHWFLVWFNFAVYTVRSWLECVCIFIVYLADNYILYVCKNQFVNRSFANYRRRRHLTTVSRRNYCIHRASSVKAKVGLLPV